MPLASRLSAGLSRRFASSAGRFQLAIGLGFVIAAAGVATVAFNDADGFADTIWGLADMFGGQQQAASAALDTGGSDGWSPWIAGHRHRARRETAHRHVARMGAARVLRAVERAEPVRGAPLEIGRRSVCVRLCDGFAFPIGTYHGEFDRASHEATCRSECPGAATALYVEPAGSESLDAAVRAGSRKTYSELPYAFHYTTVLSDACTCHPPEGNRIQSLLHDFTLRRGDAVMTASGLKVFHGAARFPYRRADFLTLARSRDVRGADRASFRAIERASLVSSPTVIAEVARSARPRPLARQATRGLEHQASLMEAQLPPPGDETPLTPPVPPARPRRP